MGWAVTTELGTQKCGRRAAHPEEAALSVIPTLLKSENSPEELLEPEGGLYGGGRFSDKPATYGCCNLTSKKQNSNFHRFTLGFTSSQRYR